MKDPQKSRRASAVRDMAIFAMLGALLFCGDILMEWLPNVHFVGILLMTYTLVYRVRALVPLYIYVILNGIYAGFSLWWMPYLYVWLPLWGIAMLLPKKLPRLAAIPLYMVICALHGMLFGALYAPFEAIVRGYNLSQTLAWIVAGLPFDAIHAVGNLAGGILVLPLSELLKRLERSR